MRVSLERSLDRVLGHVAGLLLDHHHVPKMLELGAETIESIGSIESIRRLEGRRQGCQAQAKSAPHGLEALGSLPRDAPSADQECFSVGFNMSLSRPEKVENGWHCWRASFQTTFNQPKTV